MYNKISIISIIAIIINDFNNMLIIIICNFIRCNI